MFRFSILRRICPIWIGQISLAYLSLGCVRGQLPITEFSKICDQWKQASYLKGSITNIGTDGFSSAADASPAIVYITMENGKIVKSPLPAHALRPTVSVQWEDSAEGKFWLSWSRSYPPTASNSGASADDAVIDSWDGTTFSELQRNPRIGGGGLLRVQKGMADNINGLCDDTYLTVLFRFLTVSQPGNSFSALPSLAKLQDPATYIHFIKFAKYEGDGVLLSKPCQIYTIAGGVNVFDSTPIYYRVYLSKGMSLYPIGWDELNATTNGLRREFRVVKFGNVSLSMRGAFIFPIVSTMTYYVDNHKVSANKPKETVAYKSNMTLEVNPKEECDFTIDPALADKIYDQDHHTIIQIPH